MRIQGNYYDVLGVSPEASPAEIERSYNRLARQFHPDKTIYKETARKILVRISQAYQTLIDPETRSRYDARILDTSGDQFIGSGNDTEGISHQDASAEAPKLWISSAHEALS